MENQEGRRASGGWPHAIVDHLRGAVMVRCGEVSSRFATHVVDSRAANDLLAVGGRPLRRGGPRPADARTAVSRRATPGAISRCRHPSAAPALEQEHTLPFEHGRPCPCPDGRTHAPSAERVQSNEKSGRFSDRRLPIRSACRRASRPDRHRRPSWILGRQRIRANSRPHSGLRSSASCATHRVSFGGARFTATAVRHRACGTTAIFTLMHAVMLRSLPVADPSRLYRIGDGDTCCVQGGPQDRWGMFSFPLYERLKAATPEFEEVTAFQAGGGRLSVRRQGIDTARRPLRSE